MSTTERDLERLKREREQEKDSPFAFLSSLSPTPESPTQAKEPDRDSPFAFLRNLDPGVITPEPIDPALGRFLRGGVKGVIHPIRTFLDPKGGFDRRESGRLS